MTKTLIAYRSYISLRVLPRLNDEVNEEWISYLDFRDYDSYLKEVKDFNPDWLFHLGAHTDLEFCDRMLHEYHTALTPGRSFGKKYDNFVRISICGESKDVIKGCQNLIEWSSQEKMNCW